MAAYVIGQIDVSHPGKYAEYQMLVPASLEKFNGRFLVRGGPFEHMEGSWPVSRLVIIEFDTMENARAWYSSTEYKKALKHRIGAATVTLTLVQGV
jgi:uncharacterized protein (DUF1330 family)